MYRTLNKVLKTFFTEAQIYKYLFNWSPMYKRSTGKIIEVSRDIHKVKIKIPLSYKNKNYVGSIFGGSLFAATDPIYMIQLITILGDNYVVWDKDGAIKYKRPARETVYTDFIITKDDIIKIKDEVSKHGEYNLIKTPNMVTKNGVIIAELTKTIYVANKAYYKEKRKQKMKK